MKRLLSRSRAPLLALADQALYALSNLWLQIAVARSVTNEVFGAFTVATSIFVIFSMTHQTFLVEPMFVLGPRRFPDAATNYYRMLRRSWSVYFGIGVTLCGLLLAWLLSVWSAGAIAACIVAYAVFAPILLYFWMMRRMAFALSRTEVALAGNAAYSVIMLIGLTSLMFGGLAGPYSGIALSAIASAAGAFAIARSMSWPCGSKALPRNALRLHLLYGRWAFGAEAVSWAIANCAMLILPLWLGLGASAVMRVLILLFMPLLQACSAMTLLLLRRSSAMPRHAEESSVVARSWLIFGGIAAAYGFITMLLAPPLIPLVFGTEYQVRQGWILLAAISTVCTVSAQALFVALRVAERPQDVMLAHLAGLVVILVLLIGLRQHGITGALIAQGAGWLTANALAAYFIARLRKRTTLSVSAP